MERSTLPNPGGIADLGPDDRLVVDFLNHNSLAGSTHWILEFSGSRPESVLIKTAGPRVVPEWRIAEVSADNLRSLDEMFRDASQWGPGTTSYCDIRLRRFHGEELVIEETRRGVMPLPAAGCLLLMGLCHSLQPTYDAPTFSSTASEALMSTLFAVILSPLLLVLLVGRLLSFPLGLLRPRQAS